jgi:cell wall-associated NlpC family hydrolase
VYATREDCIEAFCQRAREYLGTPYMWNYSSAPGVGVDCIGLVYQCAYACGMDLGGGTGDSDFNPWAHYITGNSGWHSHDAENFWNYGDAIHVPLSSRQRGDVISWPGHVAVYLGNDEIIEAYQGMGVVYNSLWAHGTPRGCIRLFQ